jgi:hypothetical protein
MKLQDSVRLSAEPVSEILEAIEDLPIPRNQPRLASVDVRQRPEPIDLQFEVMLI